MITSRKLRTLCRSVACTVPKDILKHLNMKSGDYMQYEITKSGKVILSKAPTPEEVK